MTYQGHPHQKFGHISYSQHGEDLFILNLCALIGLEKPSYLDLGAYHPTAISNTALLYERGSCGVNVEPNPYLINEFRYQRTRDLNLGVAVGAKSGHAKLYMDNIYSPINSLLPESFRHHPVDYKETITVPVWTLSDVINMYCPDQKYPDILFTDIEEMDLPVLKSADFTQSHPKIICTEMRQEQGLACRVMMRDKGYRQVCRIVSNLIFVHDDYYRVCR